MKEAPGTTAEHLYQKVKNGILLSIRSGQYKPKDRLPSEGELAAEYGVSRITLRRAIEELVSEGILVRRRGTGTFVNPPKYSRNVIDFMSFTEEYDFTGVEHSTIALCVEQIGPTEQDRALFSMQSREEMLYVERLRTMEGEPISIECDYIPGRYDFLLHEPREALASMAKVFAKRGIELSWDSTSVEISFATRHEADVLQVQAGSPVLMAHAVLQDQAGRPIYRAKQVLIGERSRLVFNKGERKL